MKVFIDTRGDEHTLLEIIKLCDRTGAPWGSLEELDGFVPAEKPKPKFKAWPGPKGVSQLAGRLKPADGKCSASMAILHVLQVGHNVVEGDLLDPDIYDFGERRKDVNSQSLRLAFSRLLSKYSYIEDDNDGVISITSEGEKAYSNFKDDYPDVKMPSFKLREAA